jgi:hypothetical protein
MVTTTTAASLLVTGVVVGAARAAAAEDGNDEAWRELGVEGIRNCPSVNGEKEEDVGSTPSNTNTAAAPTAAPTATTTTVPFFSFDRTR